MTKPESGAPARRKPTLPTKQITLNGQALTLKFGYRASATLEDLYEMPIKAVGSKLSSGDGILLKDLEKVIFAGLREHHPDITMEGVRDLLIAEVEQGRQFGEILEETFSAFEGAAEETPAARPQKPARPAKPKRKPRT
jgi:hypothetical protein